MSDQSPIGSVDKALRVLEELAARGPRGLTLSEVADRLGLGRPTVHRTLAALRYRGFAQQDPETGRYLLGAAALRLSDAFLQDEHLGELLHPALVALCSRTGELVHLGVLSGNEIAYLDKVEPRRSVRVWSAVGSRAPAATTALGRAMIAFRSPHRSSMAWYTDALPDGAAFGEDALWREVAAVRDRGYATECEENEPGISCLGVPLLQRDRAVAAVSITAPADRMGPDRVAEIRTVLPGVLAELLPDGLTLPAQLLAG